MKAASARPADSRAIVMLLGPTASGKSAAALQAASELPLEIVSVDSALVYRGMDIGTAKPGRDELARVPHHLIDLIDPSESYSAARFVDDASQAIEAIRARGRLPLLVGGTMLYAKALAQGLHALPRADAALRAQLDEQAAKHGWPALHARLATLDPVTAARLSPTDSQRIQRALEVVEITGVPLSRWLADVPPQGARAHSPVIVVSLEPSVRSVLHERIAARFRVMMQAGFVDEVARLRARADLNAGLPSMRCVGYRQLWEWLDAGGRTGAALDRAVESGIAASRQLAKRQLTWLRSMPDRLTIDCCVDDAGKQATTALHRAFNH